MTWIKLDDNFPDHPKMLGLSAEAGWLWVRCLAYCNRLRTDGRVPRIVAERMTRRSAAARELVAIGLWRDCADHFEVHDYLDYQSSAAKIDAAVAAKREAGSLGGKQKAANSSSKILAGASPSLQQTPSTSEKTGLPRPHEDEDPTKTKTRHGAVVSIGSSETQERPSWSGGSITSFPEFVDAVTGWRWVVQVGGKLESKAKRILSAGPIAAHEIDEFKPKADGARPGHQAGFFLGCVENGRNDALAEASKPPPPGARAPASNGAAWREIKPEEPTP